RSPVAGTSATSAARALEPRPAHAITSRASVTKIEVLRVFMFAPVVPMLDRSWRAIVVRDAGPATRHACAARSSSRARHGSTRAALRFPESVELIRARTPRTRPAHLDWCGPDAPGTRARGAAPR